MTCDITSLQKALLHYPLTLPDVLNDLEVLSWEKESSSMKVDPYIHAVFPHLAQHFLVRGVKKDQSRSYTKMKVGVVLSGGQASGGHNVIAGIYDAIKKISSQAELFGFLSGPQGIISGNYLPLTEVIIDSYRCQGGFDMLGSGRTKIETEQQLQAATQTVTELGLDGLIVIGGDDSNTNAAVLAQYFQSNGCSTTVVGVPKTIDGDLQNEHVAISFGFDSACKVYSEMIGNIARDALSAKKYYHFIKLMGRSASHIALECALLTRANYTLIGEEVSEKKMTLSQITSDIADMICKRSLLGKEFGVILIPEGLIEFIPEIADLIKEINGILLNVESPCPEDILCDLSEGSRNSFLSIPSALQKQLLMQRDPHGNVQVSMIETERLLMESVSIELKKRKEKGLFSGNFNPVDHFFGYEGRAGMPSPFDANYCYALGTTAAMLVADKCNGYMSFVEGLQRPIREWSVGGIPIVSLMRLEERKGKLKPVIKKALVDLDSIPFQYFCSQRDGWKYEDVYLFPGPIQFFGEEEIVMLRPRSLMLRFSSVNS